MKNRPLGFLATGVLGHDTEQFDYVCELHEYLWRFVRVAFPGASGDLTDFVDRAIEKLEAGLPNNALATELLPVQTTDHSKPEE